MLAEILTGLGGGGAIVGALSVIYSRRKNRAEANKIDVESSSIELDNYKKMRDIITTELQPYLHEIEQLKNEINDLKNSICRNKDCINRLR
jgi:peptidoglycan hydrolase CwlO-like protein